MVLETYKIMGTGGRSSLLSLWSLGIVGYILGEESTDHIFYRKRAKMHKL